MCIKIHTAKKREGNDVKSGCFREGTQSGEENVSTGFEQGGRQYYLRPGSSVGKMLGLSDVYMCLGDRMSVEGNDGQEYLR